MVNNECLRKIKWKNNDKYMKKLTLVGRNQKKFLLITPNNVLVFSILKLFCRNCSTYMLQKAELALFSQPTAI